MTEVYEHISDEKPSFDEMYKAPATEAKSPNYSKDPAVRKNTSSKFVKLSLFVTT